MVVRLGRRGVAGALLIVAGVIAAVFLVRTHFDPLRPPWLWPTLGEVVTPPISLDLTDVEEAGRWYSGRGVATASTGTGGLSVTGAGRDFHLSRRLHLAPGFLGRVEVRTGMPQGPVRVTPYIGGKAKWHYAVVAEPDPADPYRQVARFGKGRSTSRPVEGLRIQPDEAGARIDLVEVLVGAEAWQPLERTQADAVDWESAFFGSSGPRNLLLIVADTLRADHMSLYGYDRDTTPQLERLARYGIVFDVARSQAACTFPSVNSLLTSQPPSRFLRQPKRKWARLDGYQTIAGILKQAGFETFAVSSSLVVRATGSAHNNWEGGFDAGFDEFNEECASSPAVCVNRKAIDYIDVHDPYRPPVSHRKVFPRSYSGREEFEHGDPNPIMRAIYKDEVPHGVSARDLDHLIDLYDEEVRYLDDQLLRLFTALYDRGLLENTLIALASDHGEEFLEHGHIKHCRTVYESEVRTPLVFWVPGTEGGRRIGSLAQNLDVVPTALDYLGIQDQTLRMAGRSLRRAIDAGKVVNRYTFSAERTLQAVSDGRYKLIVDRSDESRQLFDLEADPQEMNDLAGELQGIVANLEGVLRSYDRTSRSDVLDRARQTHENLRALGYIE